MSGTKHDVVVRLVAGQRALVKIVDALKSERVVREYTINTSKKKGTAQMS